LKALTKELELTTTKVVKTSKGRSFIWKLQSATEDILHSTLCEEQWVDEEASQPPMPITTLAVLTTRISNMPATMQLRDPTAKQHLIKTKHVHQSQTQNTKQHTWEHSYHHAERASTHCTRTQCATKTTLFHETPGTLDFPQGYFHPSVRRGTG
jgi:hypothetical protein